MAVMHQIQINLSKSETQIRLGRCQKPCAAKASAALWWKELGIPKKDLHIFPCNDVCIFCFSDEDCENKFGEFLVHHFSGLCMHYFCLLLSSGLTQSCDQRKRKDFTIDKYYVYGFFIKDIFREVKRASRLRCSFCYKQGASIGCVESSCKTKFHYPCGLEKRVLSQFCDNFKSYCAKHHPQQVLKQYTSHVSTESKHTEFVDKIHMKQKHEHNGLSKCPICLEDVVCSPFNFQSLTAPCCYNVWLHRSCVQQQAYSCGIYFFRCPVCNDMKLFLEEMLRMGIYVPERDASWELAHDAYSELLQRHSVCDKDLCVCPHGRDYNAKDSEWEVVLCDLCGSSGTHIECDESVTSSNSYFACDDCVRLYGDDGALKLANEMGIFVAPSRRSRRIQRLSADVSDQPKRLRIDMAC